MTKEEIQTIRMYIKEGSQIEYSFKFPINAQLVYDESYINYDGRTIVKRKIVDEKGSFLAWLEDFENWNEQTKEIEGKSNNTYVHPSNEFVIAEIGTLFDSLGPINGTSKYINVEDLLNDKYTKLIVDGEKLILK